MKISYSQNILKNIHRHVLCGNAGLGHGGSGKDLVPSHVHRNTGNHTLWLEIPHVKCYYVISRVTSFQHSSNVKAVEMGSLSS